MSLNENNPGKGRSRRRHVRTLENGRIPQHGSDDVIDHIGAEHMRVVQLPFVLRLNAVDVKHRVDRVGISRLRTAVEPCSSEDLIVLVDVPIHASGEQPLLVSIRAGLERLAYASIVGIAVP